MVQINKNDIWTMYNALKTTYTFLLFRSEICSRFHWLSHELQKVQKNKQCLTNSEAVVPVVPVVPVVVVVALLAAILFVQVPTDDYY